ncbi:hypothetical protein [Nocardioides sp. B-3]|uniref:hypothetical protein n=1 Tax=Nocardioides sp. B-3 TaxID=2895565 RepID=UPI00215373B5|nr:hypothetical protein [Nocardioides sp. B-3]UUZ57988.1 hypothetical protein LP418_16840 [Nocardioides sp. B-3]
MVRSAACTPRRETSSASVEVFGTGGAYGESVDHPPWVPRPQSVAAGARPADAGGVGCGHRLHAGLVLRDPQGQREVVGDGRRCRRQSGSPSRTRNRAREDRHRLDRLLESGSLVDDPLVEVGGRVPLGVGRRHQQGATHPDHVDDLGADADVAVLLVGVDRDGRVGSEGRVAHLGEQA